MPQKISGLALLIGIHLLASCWATSLAADQLMLGTGRPGSGSHQLGVGLTSLVKVIVLPKEGIDLDLANQNSTLDDQHLLIDRQSELQVLLADQVTDAFRSVMTFRSHDTADDPVLELIARADVSANVVYSITKAIFENGPFLSAVDEKAWDLSLDQALHGLQHSIHPGALRYYQEIGGVEQQIADGPSSKASLSQTDRDAVDIYGESTFYIYYDSQDARLDGAAQDQLAAACRYAKQFQSTELQVSTHLSDPRTDVVEGLADKRLQSVITTLGQDANCGPNMTIIELVESKAMLPIELFDADEDRLEITIVLPHARQ